MPVHIFIDVALIGFILIGALVGMYLGFFKTLISLIGWTVSLIVGIIFAQMVADVLLQVPIFSRLLLGGGDGWSLAGQIESWLPGELAYIYASDAMVQQDAINISMNNSLLGFLLTPLFHMVVDSAAVESGLTVSEIFAMALANHIFVIFVGFLIMMVVRIFVALATRMADSFLENRNNLQTLDRAGGFFLGMAKYCLYVFMIFIGFSFISAMPFMSPVRNQIERTHITTHVVSRTVLVADRYLGGDDGLIARIIELSGRGNTQDNQAENNEDEYNYD